MPPRDSQETTLNGSTGTTPISTALSSKVMSKTLLTLTTNLGQTHWESFVLINSSWVLTGSERLQHGDTTSPPASTSCLTKLIWTELEKEMLRSHKTLTAVITLLKTWPMNPFPLPFHQMFIHYKKSSIPTTFVIWQMPLSMNNVKPIPSLLMIDSDVARY